VLAALRDEPLDVVVTLGSSADPAALGEVPANATVEGFIPQAELLPRCSAVVHHAGGGTMFGALAHGLPQVALPQGADNFVNAAILERAGAGISLGVGHRSPAELRAAVRSVLDDPRFAAGARATADALAAMPGPEELAAALRAHVAAARA
jgi:MGT family glycosyltransferase